MRIVIEHLPTWATVADTRVSRVPPDLSAGVQLEQVVFARDYRRGLGVVIQALPAGAVISITGLA